MMTIMTLIGKVVVAYIVRFNGREKFSLIPMEMKESKGMQEVIADHIYFCASLGHELNSDGKVDNPIANSIFISRNFF